MSCFKKTNDGNKEMIMFTIAKQFYQSTLASKSKKILKCHSGFVRFEDFRKLT